MGERLFESKARNILAIVFSVIYILSLALGSGISIMHFDFDAAAFRYLINTVVILLLNVSAPLTLILAAATKGKSKLLRKYFVPIGFGIRCILALGLAFSSGELALIGGNDIMGIVLYIFVCLQGIAVILMFIGTLYDFEHSAILKWGSILFIAASASTNFTEFVVLGYAREFTVPKFFGLIALILFHIAILLISQKPKEE